MIMLPTMSAGMRSGVNWMREYFRCSTRQRAQQRGLAQPGNAFEQHVAAGQQADQDAFDDVVLADDDLADFLAHLIEMTGGELECRLGTHVFILAVTGCYCLGVMYYNTRASCRPTILLPIPPNSG